MRKMLLIDGVLYVVSIWLLLAAWKTLQVHHAFITTVVYSSISIVLTVLSAPVMGKVFLFLILAPWHELMAGKRTTTHTLQGTPLVSVILPAYNEEIGIIATVKTLLASSYQNIELIIVNDGSTDNSDQVIRAFVAQYNTIIGNARDAIQIRYIYKRNEGKGAALNTGIQVSRGEIIVCIDADCLLTKNCILHFVLAMQDPTIQAVCGNIKVGNRNTLLGQVQMVEYALSFYSRQTDAILGTLYVISGAGGAYRRSVFDQVGLYDPHLRGGGEDVDLSIRVQQAGMHIGFAPEAIVYTEVPIALRGLLKQRVRWTRSRFDTFRRYSRLLLSRRREHNKLLTWFVLPLIAFNDWFYLLKVVLKVVLYGYCLVVQQYTILAMLMLITTVLSAIPLATNKEYRPYLFLAPIYWLLGFIPFFIEAYAVWAALWDILHRREAQWQQWNRQGAIAQVRKGRK